MRVSQIQIEQFRSFVDSGPIELGPVNVFIGPNNAGKSSVLKALYLLQNEAIDADIRTGTNASVVQLDLVGVNGIRPWGDPGDADSGALRIEKGRNQSQTMNFSSIRGGNASLGQLPMKEPDHFIVPFFSRRKTAGYMHEVNEEHASAVGPDFSRLTAKLSRLGNRSFPFHQQYATTCEAILGFVVTAIPSTHGQLPGIYLPDGSTLPMDQMGEGVPNIVGLLADLAQYQGKLFLIEEPENDLHPQALKALLGLILESSANNQIVVSTHSNIVARYLGAAPESKLYYVRSEPKTLPSIAEIEPVPPTPAARLRVLRELGYSFSDFDLWDGWLILEESSAERIIRDYLVPWFAPKLSRIRTLSAGGNSLVEPTFDDFNRLVRFTHLEEAYKDSAWVLVDGDETGRKVVERLHSNYPSWSPDRFDCLDEPQFERYYPEVFQGKVDAALALTGQDKRQAKKSLLDEVRAWLDEDDARGRAALEASAMPVIDRLQRIQEELKV